MISLQIKLKSAKLYCYPIPRLVYKINQANKQQIDAIMLLGFFDWELYDWFIDIKEKDMNHIKNECIKNYIELFADSGELREIKKILRW